MKFDFNLATFVVGLMSLAGVIANIVVTSINNRKKRYTDMITQRRLRTFQSVIDNSSNCIKSVYGIITGNSDENSLLQLFVTSKTQIFYDTNYKAPAEKELRDALAQMQDLLVGYIESKDRLSTYQKQKIFKTLKCGADYYQTISGVYCKCEWIRIKETTISVKENIDTQKEYFDRIKEIESSISENKKILFENTFDKIINDK